MLAPTLLGVDGMLGPVAALGDGLFLCYADTPNTTNSALTASGLQRMCGRESRDGGLTWSDGRVLFDCGEAPGVVTSPVPYGDERGRLHVLWLRFYTYGDLTPATARCELWHAASGDSGATWGTPARVDFGHSYTGSINSIIRLSSGRLLVPLSYLTARTTGKFVSMAVYSDDDGATWGCSRTDLSGDDSAGLENMGEGGMLEPVVVERSDGRVWMLIRTTLGRLYESFSEDAGETWSLPEPTRFVSSNAPAGVLRLADGRMVMAWNRCEGEPFIGGISYARQVLYGAVSSDDGRTWSAAKALVGKAQSESVHAQYCYPFLVESAAGRVLLTYHRVNTRAGEDWSNPTRSLMHFDVDGLAARTVKK